MSASGTRPPSTRTLANGGNPARPSGTSSLSMTTSPLLSNSPTTSSTRSAAATTSSTVFTGGSIVAGTANDSPSRARSPSSDGTASRVRSVSDFAVSPRGVPDAGVLARVVSIASRAAASASAGRSGFPEAPAGAGVGALCEPVAEGAPGGVEPAVGAGGAVVDGGADDGAAVAGMGGTGGGEAAGADFGASVSVTRASAGGFDTLVSTAVPDWVVALVDTTGAGGFAPPDGAVRLAGVPGPSP